MAFVLRTFVYSLWRGDPASPHSRYAPLVVFFCQKMDGPLPPLYRDQFDGVLCLFGAFLLVRRSSGFESFLPVFSFCRTRSVILGSWVSGCAVVLFFVGVVFFFFPPLGRMVPQRSSRP